MGADVQSHSNLRARRDRGIIDPNTGDVLVFLLFVKNIPGTI